MQKETKTEDTIGFVVTFLSLVPFKLGRAQPHPLLTMPMTQVLVVL